MSAGSGFEQGGGGGDGEDEQTVEVDRDSGGGLGRPDLPSGDEFAEEEQQPDFPVAGQPHQEAPGRPGTAGAGDTARGDERTAPPPGQRQAPTEGVDETTEKPAQEQVLVQQTVGRLGPGSTIERTREAIQRGRAASARLRGRTANIFQRPQDYDVREVFGDRPTPSTGRTSPGQPAEIDFTGVDDRVMDAFGQEGRRQARNSEELRAKNQLVSRSPLIDSSDVIFVERNGEVIATVNSDTAEVLAQSGFGQPEFIVEGGVVGETGGGEDLGFQGGDPVSVAIADAERSIEEALGGDIDPRTDLEVTQTDDGIRVQLTDEGRDVVQSDSEQRLEETIAAETGREVDLLPGDFRVTDSGTVELTQKGIDKVATEPLTEFVEDQQAPAPGLNFPTLTDQFPTGVEGPTVESIGVERDFGDAFGSVELQVFGDRPATPGPRAAPRTRTGKTITIDEAIAEAVDQATLDVETLPGGPREDIPGPRVGPRERVPTSEVGPTQRGIAEGAAAIPGIIPSSAGFIVDVGDFGVELATEAIDLPEIEVVGVTPGPKASPRRVVGGGIDFEAVDRLVSDAAQVATNQAAVGAAAGIESPIETTARAGTTLVGTGLLFGGAAAVGGRTSLATRALIQPGEEALGIGGHALTRQVAGRGAAETLFPRREPLIFSEEVFLRNLRSASARAAGGAGRLRTRLAEADYPFERSDARLGSRQQIVEAAAEAEGVPVARVGGETVAGGEVELGPVEGVEPSGLDVETVDELMDAAETDVEPGGAASGGGFDIDIEQQTRSGVAVERVRVPRVEAESPALEQFPHETGQSRVGFRAETAIDQGLFEGVGIDPVEIGEVSSGVTGQLDAPGELETPGETDAPTEFIREPEFPRFQFDQRFTHELEIETELERETESEREAEVFRDQRQRFDRLDRAFGRPTKTGVFEYEVPSVEQAEKKFEKMFDRVERSTARAGQGVDVDPIEAPGIDVDLDLDLEDIDPF